MMDNIVTYCCDIGSVKQNAFGWVRIDHNDTESIVGSGSISMLIDSIVSDIHKKRVLTIGMECPLFLPIPTSETQLSIGRDGEKDRSCFAPAGGYVALLGLHEAAYILRRIASTRIQPLLSWRMWNPEKTSELLLWEAFVSGDVHSDRKDHCQDAATAATEFVARVKNGNLYTDMHIKDENNILSLIGSAVLWSHMSDNIQLLYESVLVVKPTQRYNGEVKYI